MTVELFTMEEEEEVIHEVEEVINEEEVAKIYKINLRLIYPAPIKQLPLHNAEDATGFTISEKATLNNAWRIIEKNIYEHAIRLYTEFYAREEWLLERFKNPVTGKFNITALYKHAHSVLRIYGELITRGLQHLSHMNVLLQKFQPNHEQCRISADDVRVLTEFVAEYLISALESQATPTFVAAIKKLSISISDAAAGKQRLSGTEYTTLEEKV